MIGGRTDRRSEARRNMDGFGRSRLWQQAAPCADRTVRTAIRRANRARLRFYVSAQLRGTLPTKHSAQFGERTRTAVQSHGREARRRIPDKGWQVGRKACGRRHGSRGAGASSGAGLCGVRGGNRYCVPGIEGAIRYVAAPGSAGLVARQAGGEADVPRSSCVVLPAMGNCIEFGREGQEILSV